MSDEKDNVIKLTNASSLRGDHLDLLYWPDAYDFYDERFSDLFKDIPGPTKGTEIILESTAHGYIGPSMLEVLGVKKFKPWFDPTVIHVNFRRGK